MYSGYDTGFFGGTIALDSFIRDFGMDTMSKSESDEMSANLVSLFQGGSFFGAALQLPFTQTFGRKWSVVASNIIFIVSGFMQVFSNGSIPLMSTSDFDIGQCPMTCVLMTRVSGRSILWRPCNR